MQCWYLKRVNAHYDMNEHKGEIVSSITFHLPFFIQMRQPAQKL